MHGATLLACSALFVQEDWVALVDSDLDGVLDVEIIVLAGHSLVANDASMLVVTCPLTQEANALLVLFRRKGIAWTGSEVACLFQGSLTQQV